MLYNYFTLEEPQIIIKYPTPYNKDKIVYVDLAGTYYKYELKEVTCPSDKKDIYTIPIQI
jgi:hypothetical protein